MKHYFGPLLDLMTSLSLPGFVDVLLVCVISCLFFLFTNLQILKRISEYSYTLFFNRGDSYRSHTYRVSNIGINQQCTLMVCSIPVIMLLL